MNLNFQLEDLRVFCLAARKSSFAATAVELGTSPAYLERRGMPASIAELSQHDCLVLRDRNQAFGVWRLTGANGTEKVKVTGRLSSNNAEIVRGWAIDGHGIVLLAHGPYALKQ